eukprot:TRINITY_DN28384_c0_g1_i1.p1 TRINITY_DN28384_c0_g1~~TRINITY_DN28384_c0_g1_i1.p1  ORF type:complete len:118 (+),score=5.51 TRINITY_DN28384_c0_g1_i1:46-354(+)
MGLLVCPLLNVLFIFYMKFSHSKEYLTWPILLLLSMEHRHFLRFGNHQPQARWPQDSWAIKVARSLNFFVVFLLVRSGVAIDLPTPPSFLGSRWGDVRGIPL